MLRSRKLLQRLVMGVVICAAMSGCKRVSLKKIPVVSMTPTLVSGTAVAPGTKVKMVVTFKTADGRTLTTTGVPNGVVRWSDLALTSTVVKASRKGSVSLSADPRLSDKKTGHVDFSIPSQPMIHAGLDVPVRYDYAFRGIFAGSSGFDGLSGTNGTTGSSGSSGSLDPDHPSAGGDGGNGTDGTDGGNGGDGGSGPAVSVQIRWRSKSHLLQASVSDGRSTRYFLVDPNGGSLTVASVGGSGGRGGSGGKGGSGGSGGIGSPSGSSGRSGSDGHDGRSGSDGSPGTVTVVYDPSAQPYLAVLHVPKGTPMTEGTVAKMW